MTVSPGATDASQREIRSQLPDWNQIEPSFRAGAQSLRSIAAAHGVAEATIRFRAQRAGWPRGPAQKITHCALRRSAIAMAMAEIVHEFDQAPG